MADDRIEEARREFEEEQRELFNAESSGRWQDFVDSDDIQEAWRESEKEAWEDWLREAWAELHQNAVD